MKLEPINTPKGPLNEGGDNINDNEEVMERVKQTEHDGDVSDISDGKIWMIVMKRCQNPILQEPLFGPGV